MFAGPERAKAYWGREVSETVYTGAGKTDQIYWNRAGTENRLLRDGSTVATMEAEIRIQNNTPVSCGFTSSGMTWRIQDDLSESQLFFCNRKTCFDAWNIVGPPGLGGGALDFVKRFSVVPEDYCPSYDSIIKSCEDRDVSPCKAEVVKKKYVGCKSYVDKAVH